MKRTWRLRFAAIVLGGVGLIAPARARGAEDVITRMRQMYGDLASYSDTGKIIVEYGTSSTDVNTFTTCLIRSPRHFVLDVHKSADEYVIWGDPDAFHTWWAATGGRYDYPNPNNATALAVAPNALGTAGKIPTLLYAKAQLGGALANLSSAAINGVEDVDGHKCHRLSQEIADTYAATGRQTNVHQITVWIDTESLLIRKVLEEWKPLPGQRSRTITTFDPKANPQIDPASCDFKPKAES